MLLTAAVSDQLMLPEEIVAYILSRGSKGDRRDDFS